MTNSWEKEKKTDVRILKATIKRTKKRLSEAEASFRTTRNAKNYNDVLYYKIRIPHLKDLLKEVCSEFC